MGAAQSPFVKEIDEPAKAAPVITAGQPQLGAAAKRRHTGQSSLSFVVHAWRKLVLEEEPNHFAGGIRTPRKGVGTGRAATRPSVTGPMNDPLFYHRLAAGVDMQHAAVREPTRYLAFFDPLPEQRALAQLRND